MTDREKNEQDIPLRQCKSKRYIIKVMFLCAVARPRFDKNGQCTFDGKIGCWPFVERVEAKRDSVNRPKGTLETKPMNVTKAIYTDYILNKVISAIIAKWPHCQARTVNIGIRQDNPNTHIDPMDPQWIQAKDSHPKFKFYMKKQPPNSPDTNILDLGFFRSLQALQWQQPPATTIDGLIANVMAAWEQYDPVLLNKIFLTHQRVCNAILETEDGGNDFGIPHMGKEKLIKEGRLPISTTVSTQAMSHFSQL